MAASLVLCRLFHYASSLLLFGVSLFQCGLAPSALARSLDLWLGRVALCLGAISLASAVVWLLLAAGSMGEGWSDVLNPDVVSAVLFETAFGQVWQWHLAFEGLLMLVLAARRLVYWPALLVLSGSALSSLGFVGHAVMIEGALGWINRISHVLHLLAAGFWLGCLIPLLACLGNLNGTILRGETSIALRRFSGLGHCAVATVVLTGIANICLVLRRWPIDLGSPYQALLLAKIGVVSLMIVLAIVNRYVLVPRLREDTRSLARLRAGTIAEECIGFGVIGLVSLIGTLAPQ